jgi:hypothetical protein
LYICKKVKGLLLLFASTAYVNVQESGLGTKSAVRFFKMRRMLGLCRAMKKLVVVCAEVVGEILLALVLDDYEMLETRTEGAAKALISEERVREEAEAHAEGRPA